MREAEHITQFLTSSYESNAWHGPALLETLEGVDSTIATSKLAGITHSIWELVVHLAQWKDFVRQRIERDTPVIPTDAEDWPEVGQQNAQTWSALLSRLHRSQEQLIATVRQMSAEKLDQTVPGKDYSYRVMLLGSAQHDAYHAGQIQLIKRAK